MSKKLIALLAGGALTAFAALPANAEYINDIYWNIEEGNLDSVDDDLYFDSYGLDESSFDVSLAGVDDFYTFDCSDAGSTTELDDDVIYACEGFEDSGIEGIQWDGHVKVFAGAFNGLVARQVVSLKNVSAEDISVDYEYKLDTEECYYTSYQNAGTIGTPDGDTTLEDGEIWYVCGNENYASEAIAFGTDGFARGDYRPADGDLDNGMIEEDGESTDDEGFGVTADENIIDVVGPDEFYVWNEDVTISAGETITFVYFYRSVGSVESGSPAEGAETNDETLSYMDEVFGSVDAVTGNERLFEDIDSAYNWGAVAEEESLADTGVDASGIALGGLAVLAAGVAVVARRRVRA